MAKVLLSMTVSLDGFINDRHGHVDRLYPDLEDLRESEYMQEWIRATGSVVMGRHAYDMANGDFTGYEFQTPIFVLTHEPPEQAPRGQNDRLTITFVTDGVERAIEMARAAAGTRDVVVVGGASTAQQCLNAGLVDELEVSIRPVLFGAGLRLLEHLDAERIELEPIHTTEAPTATDLRYRVVTREPSPSATQLN
jgi:dihydrofolate reductase